MPNVIATPARPTSTKSTDQPSPCGPTIADIDAIVPIIPSPRAMITSSP